MLSAGDGGGKRKGGGREEGGGRRKEEGGRREEGRGRRGREEGRGRREEKGGGRRRREEGGGGWRSEEEGEEWTLIKREVLEGLQWQCGWQAGGWVGGNLPTEGSWLTECLSITHQFGIHTLFIVCDGMKTAYKHPPC